MFERMGTRIEGQKAEKQKFEKLQEIPQVDPKSGRMNLDVAIKDINVYSDIVGDVMVENWETAQHNHGDKVAAFRNRKKYEFALYDDEDDFEAEKIKSDIKNFNQEHFFNLYFNDGDLEALENKALLASKK